MAASCSFSTRIRSWSASLSEVAIRVRVGLAEPTVGKIEDPATKRF
jgi:hypothetical protein